MKLVVIHNHMISLDYYLDSNDITYYVRKYCTMS